MLLKKELTDYNRYQAFAIHMTISLVLFFILLVCITQYWYPGILFDTGNGWKAIGMIVGIDLVLGPLLTLIVFNPKKNSLKFDLSVIALVQAAALIYGTWTIHNTRPVALAFINTSFMTIFANSEIGSKVKTKAEELNTTELFYIFNDSSSNNSLQLEFFESYSKHAQQLKELNSSYINGDLVNIDPLLSPNRFIQVDPETGKILKFIKK